MTFRRSTFIRSFRKVFIILRSLKLTILVASSIFLSYFTYEWVNYRHPLKFREGSAHNLLRKDLHLNVLSELFQNELQALQNSDCDRPNFICGIDHSCGLGCQLHHKIACLMISHALKMPVIHNETKFWLYSTPWKEAFEPFGSKCKPSHNTYTWNWFYRKLMLYNGTKIMHVIEYPLTKGLVIDTKFCLALGKVHSNPFLWFVGQFMKFGVKLKPNLTSLLKDKREELGLQSPIVGIHVRRTDKGRETNNISYHEISEYMDQAEKYFVGLEIQQNVPLGSIKRRVFVASEDSTVLPEVKLEYPSWDVIGLDKNETLQGENDRWDSLSEIIMDIWMLADCDFVVCGMSSNVCRLVLELKSIRQADAEQRVASLEHGYFLGLLYHSLPPVFLCKGLK